jgi:hypothetical protein
MGAGLWNRGNVIVGLFGRWHGDTIHRQPGSSLAGLKIDLGLVVSNDAIHYREPIREFTFVERGTPEQWDSEGILQANAFANTDTETFIWYSHWDTTRPDVTPPLPQEISPRMIQKGEGVGLLTMPRDRFGYFTKLLPVSQERRPQFNKPLTASCLTRSIRLTRPGKLSVNVDDVSTVAPLKIELVDDAERTLQGYSAQLTASSLKADVQWSGKRPLPANGGFRVKVTWPTQVDNPKLYAIYIEQ